MTFRLLAATLILLWPCGFALSQHPTVQARASELDKRFGEYPEIDYVFELKGKTADLQHGAAPTADQHPKGQLVIWLMSHKEPLFSRLNSYGLHAIQPHYANKWFSKVCREVPIGDQARGNVRLEATTGLDASDDVAIQPQDGMQERARVLLVHLAEVQPDAGWAQFLTADGKGIHWDKVIMAGSSHGSTSSARFAKHQKVGRVVMLCGPRDQYQNWQSLPSATPPERYFGFSHVLDQGWVENHYCRSWELLGLHQFGAIVDVDKATPPYGNTRRLTSNADVGGDAGKAHGAVTPSGRNPTGPGGTFLYEPVWRYLFTHPVDQVGEPVAGDDTCVVKPQK